MSYTWSVNLVYWKNVDSFDKVVDRVLWTCSDTSKTPPVTVSDITPIETTLDPDSFIEWDKLTENDILGFLPSVVKTDAEARLANQTALPERGKGLPWESVEVIKEEAPE